MYMVYVAILIPLSWLHTSFAGFTKPTRWPGSNLVIQQNSAGTWCFLPVSGETTAIDCKGDHADLQGTLTAHLRQDLSIAYYNAIDNTRRGGATWSITNETEIVHLCASGKGGDGIVQTICSTVKADDTFSGTPYCEVALGPREVSDGCYTTSTTTAIIPPSSRTSSSTSKSSQSSQSSQTSQSTTTTTTSSPANSSATKTSSSTVSLPTTINIINGPKKINWVPEILIPILVAIIGLVTAVVVKRYC